MIRFLRDFARLFAERWPRGAILYTVEQLVVLAIGIALQVAAQLIRGPIKREGPRLDDLSATGVQPGAIIPATHGHTTAPGTVISQTRLKETKKKEKQGGKGSPTVETTTYSYSIPAVAVAFSRREIKGIVRIKANEKVIYEFTEDEGLVYRNFSEIEIFPGTEEQSPSGILEAHEGAGNVPAYRGTAYFVLADLQLADFGNRMPAFKVEVSGEVSDEITVTDGPAETWLVDFNHTIIDWDRRRLYGQRGDGSQSDESEFLEAYDLDTLARILVINSGFGAWNGLDPDTGYLIGSHSFGGDSWNYTYDPATNTWITIHDVTFTFSTTDSSDFILNYEGAPSVTLKHAGSGEKAILSSWSLSVRAHDFDALTLDQEYLGPGDGTGDVWVAGWVGGNGTEASIVVWGNTGGDGDRDEFRIYEYAIQSDGSVVESLVDTITVADVHPDLATMLISNGPNPMYDTSDGSWVFYFPGTDQDANPVAYVVKWTEAEGLAWVTDISGRREFDLGVTRSYHLLSGGHWFFGEDVTGNYTLIDLETGARTDFDDTVLHAEPNGGAWNDEENCLYQWKVDDGQVLQKACLELGVGEVGTSIGAILRAAMTEWEPDVSPLVEGDHFNIAAALFEEPYLVTGATFTQINSPREIAEMCVAWKPVVFFEGGDAIEFKERDGEAAATIRHQDMGQRDRGAEVLPTVTVSRADDVQLPRETRIKFLDENRFFSANAAYARITRSRSSLVQEIDLPFAGTPAEAKFAAWTVQGEAYAQRREITGFLTLPYFILEPGDIIDLPDNDGNLIEARVNRSDLGANFIIEMKAADHVNSYDNITFAAETGVLDAIPLVRPEAALTYALDLPRLTDDADVDDGLQLLVGLGGTYEAWKGGIIYRDTLSGGGATAFGESFADEETNFVEVAETRISVDAGTIVTAPSGDVDEFTVDRVSTMRVAFDTFEPAFSTLTDGQFLTTAENVFAIGNNVDGWEIVQAQEVAQIDAQTWDFSVLRRGLRGTEWAIGQAEAGDEVVRLETATLSRDPFTEPAIGETITYRGVTFNMDVASASDLDVIVVGRGLIPYSPLLGEVYRDGDGTITGTLYARPLQADDADQFFLVDPDFEIDVKDAPGGTVLRTITLTDTGDFTYSDAQQVTDFGSVQAAVDAEVFQLDDDGDRGYGREVVL